MPPGLARVGEEADRRPRADQDRCASTRPTPPPPGRPDTAPARSRDARRPARSGRCWSAPACARRWPPRSPAPRRAPRPAARWPPSSSSAGSPERSARAASSIAPGAACGVGAGGSMPATVPPSSQHVSDGRISVAGPPGAACAACTAAAQSAPTVVGARRRAGPDRDAAREALGVRRERRIERPMIGRLVADQVDDRRPRTPRIVQIGQAVRQARAAMQQGRRPAGPSCARSRPRRRSRRSPADRARSACRASGRAPRRNASPTCRGWRNTCRPRTPEECAPGFRLRSSHPHVSGLKTCARHAAVGKARSPFSTPCRTSTEDDRRHDHHHLPRTHVPGRRARASHLRRTPQPS